MTPILFLFGAVHLAGVALVIVAVFKAPLGYEDGNGFHADSEPEQAQSTAGVP